MKIQYEKETKRLLKVIPTDTLSRMKLEGDYIEVGDSDANKDKYFQYMLEQKVEHPVTGVISNRYGDRILTEDELLEGLRYARNKALTETDWAILPDSPLSEIEKQSMLEYRQSLRDITEPIKTGEKTIDDISLPLEPVGQKEVTFADLMEEIDLSSAI